MQQVTPERPLAASPGLSLPFNKFIYIPFDNAAFNVEGVLLTGRQQVAWLGQLMHEPQGFVLHADGKHKLHHGEWILMTLGTHYLRWEGANKKHSNLLTHSFVPLVYLFCKQHESDGSCLVLVCFDVVFVCIYVY